MFTRLGLTERLASSGAIRLEALADAVNYFDNELGKQGHLKKIDFPIIRQSLCSQNLNDTSLSINQGT